MSFNKRKKLLLILIIFLCCFIAIGYFVLIHAMVIKGNVKIEHAKWNVKFESINTEKTLGEAYNYKSPKLNSYDIEFYAGFKEIGDTITYSVTIKNAGNLDARLTNTYFIPRDNPYLECSMKGLSVGDVLKRGESKNVKVTVKYNPKKQVLDTKFERVTLTFDWQQYNRK